MEISSMTSHFGLQTRMLAAAAAASPSPSRTTTTTTNSRRTLNVSAKFSSGISLTSHVSPLFGGSVTSDFSTHGIRRSPLSSSSFSSSRVKRNVITMVIPFVRESAMKYPPPDLASYLLKYRIVYLGMNLYPAVAELLVAEFMHLNYESYTEPIYFYINSTNSTKPESRGSQLGYHSETFTVYSAMEYTRAPIYTLAVGNAWGESALLLAAGDKGYRAALPSASIMLKQPFGRGQGQATVVDNLQKAITEDKKTLVELYAKHTGKTLEQIEKDIRRPKYFSPSEAVEYGIIDKVLYNERSPKDRGVVSNLKEGNL